VAEEDTKIIACATFLIESKLIRNGSQIMHIEDIVVDKSNRGRGLGIDIVKLLVEKSKTMGCYKVILNCSDEYIDFYKKNGFITKGCHMAIYH
jgi:glucosamine-phosphate N-acetyltransferase